MLPAGIAAPPRDCSLCPRLAAYRQANRGANPDWFNAPVPSFGAAEARLLVVGMAPGLRGANRTGRPDPAACRPRRGQLWRRSR